MNQLGTLIYTFGLVALIISIIIRFLFAMMMDRIADSKGCNKNMFWWCFFLPICGALMVIAMPDYISQENTARISYALTQLTADHNPSDVTNNTEQ